MIEVTGDLWTFTHKQPIVRCITTNGMVKRDGSCVMGRGCAKEAATRYRSLPLLLGQMIRRHGNMVFHFSHASSPDLTEEILTFPVKRRWMEPADPKLILKSAAALHHAATGTPDTIYLLPRPGCGNGQLKWKDVKPLLTFLPDNVLVITKEAA